MRMFEMVLAIVAVSLTATAALADAPAVTPPITAPAPVAAHPALNGAFVYVYSFLDIREAQLGRPCLDLVNRDLVAALKASRVDAKVLNFKDSPTSSTFALYGNAGTVLPLKQVVAENAADERATGARYRLVVFPSNFEVMGAGQYWDIRWSLIDIATNRVVWTATIGGNRVIWWRTTEGAEPRAKGIVDKFMDELRKGGMVGAPS